MTAWRLIVAAGLALLASAPPAMAAPVVTAISGATPLARACAGSGAQRGSELETTLAVNPRDPSRLVAAWEQDRYRVGGGSAALGVSLSRDGGATWTPTVVPGITTCTGPRGRNSHPWLSIGPDGTAYLASAPGTLDRRSGRRAGVAVSISRDAGATWTETATLAPPDGPATGDAYVTADPSRPGYAYATWTSLDRAYTALTTDAGRTWSAPVPVPGGAVLEASAVSVAPDGALLMGVLRAGSRSETLAATRSLDGGATWSRPARVGTVTDSTPFDRRSQVALQSGSVAAPALVAAADGSAYAAWVATPASGRARVVVARSPDGGVTWSSGRPAIAGSYAAFAPSLATAPDGAVAVTAYRLHRGGTGDALGAVSRDGAGTWVERRLSSPFALRRAPRELGGQRYLGDHFGLAALPDGGFAAAPALAPPLATSGPSDVFLGRLAPGL